MKRTCRSCPQEHPIYAQATPDWYRPSVGEQVAQAVGCAAHMVALLIVAFLLWALIFGFFAVATT